MCLNGAKRASKMKVFHPTYVIHGQTHINSNSHFNKAHKILSLTKKLIGFRYLEILVKFFFLNDFFIFRKFPTCLTFNYINSREFFLKIVANVFSVICWKWATRKRWFSGANFRAGIFWNLFGTVKKKIY